MGSKASAETVVILAAGEGTRMRSARAKVLHPLCGRPMVAWAVEVAASLQPRRIVLVVGRDGDEIEAAARDAAGGVEVRSVVQEPRLGTGHALQVAAAALEGPRGGVVVLYGDMPLLRPESLVALVAARAGAGPGANSLLSAHVDEPTGYGRVLRDADGRFRGVVEQRDATAEERAIDEINLGAYAFDGEALLDALPRLTPHNDQGEYYLTDVLGLLVEEGRAVIPVVLEEAGEAQGVNDLAELAAARWGLQLRVLEAHMRAGVSIEDPLTTYIEHGVTIGAGTSVLPCTVIRSGVVIGEGCEVGPFTHLRRGTVLEDGAEVGNFTECKQATVGAGSKAKHLSYLGDTRIGRRTNIGAGTIFANYDGQKKHRSEVGDDVFVGSGTIVVAPNSLPDGSTTGAGAVVTRSARIEPGETWVGVPARKLEPRARDEGGS